MSQYRAHSLNFVNGSRSIAILSGYAKRLAPDRMLLMQSDNSDQHITIQIKADTRPIRPDIPYTVRCRLRGERHGNQHHTMLEAIEPPHRAALTAAPKRITMLNTLRYGVKGGRAGADFNPFADLDGLRDEITAKLTADGMPVEIVDEILRPTDKGERMQRFINHVVLSGFVGHKAYYPPADGEAPDHGYCLFLIHQHADAERAIAVRVRGADSRFLKLLPIMHPVNVVASLRVQTDTNADGEVTRILTCEATRENVGGAVASDFEHDKFPHWWAAAVAAHHATRRATRDASQSAAAAAAAAPKARKSSDGDDSAATASADAFGIAIDESGF